MTTLNIGNVEITRLKHAGFKIRALGLVIYIDPYKETVEPADLILVTHEHFDHFDPETISSLRKSNTIISGPTILADKIINNFHPLKPGETFKGDNIKIAPIPAYNISASHHPKEKGYLGYILEIAGTRIYHAGDTDKTEEMVALKDIDVAMLPIGGIYTMDEVAAAEAHRTGHANRRGGVVDVSAQRGAGKVLE